ncbi:MAG: binding-protein-dependent transport system inner rane component [Myxococcales bacterium]|nr:binding-protein-dependent transport system inner rane component [Myxococcales bacterium]
MRRFFGKVGIGPTFGLLLLTAFFLAALVGPWLAPYGPEAQNLGHLLEKPSHAHLLGTDENGCDVLSQLLWGARLAAGISLTVVALCLAIGTAVGTIAGYFGGWVDEVIMRAVDVLLAFPGILLNLAIVAMVPSAGVGVFVFALTINGWVGYARVARGQVLQVREREFVQAARALGASPWRIMLRHVVPNTLSPLIVQATFGFAGVILVEASLSFLGVGRLHNYSWGSLLSQGTTYLWRTQHLAMAPGIAIATVVLGCNLVGDGLRDRFDPRRSIR